MIDLHPPGCACGDCRNRRLICGLESGSDGYLASEAERFGSGLKADDVGREAGRRRLDAGSRPIEARQI